MSMEQEKGDSLDCLAKTYTLSIYSHKPLKPGPLSQEEMKRPTHFLA